jgi:hypothetical protein
MHLGTRKIALMLTPCRLMYDQVRLQVNSSFCGSPSSSVPIEATIGEIEPQQRQQMQQQTQGHGSSTDSNASGSYAASRPTHLENVSSEIAKVLCETQKRFPYADRSLVMEVVQLHTGQIDERYGYDCKRLQDAVLQEWLIVSLALWHKESTCQHIVTAKSPQRQARS